MNFTSSFFLNAGYGDGVSPEDLKDRATTCVEEFPTPLHILYRAPQNAGRQSGSPGRWRA